MLKPKSPLYEIIAVDWVFSVPAASDMIWTSKQDSAKYDELCTLSVKIQICICVTLIDASGLL